MARSLKKGPFADESLLKKIDAMNAAGDKQVIKTWSAVPQSSADDLDIQSRSSWKKTCACICYAGIWLNQTPGTGFMSARTPRTYLEKTKRNLSKIILEGGGYIRSVDIDPKLKRNARKMPGLQQNYHMLNVCTESSYVWMQSVAKDVKTALAIVMYNPRSRIKCY